MTKGGEGGYRQINKNFNACAFDEYLSSQTSHLPSLPGTERISPRVIRVLGVTRARYVDTRAAIRYKLLPSVL